MRSAACAAGRVADFAILAGRRLEAIVSPGKVLRVVSRLLEPKYPEAPGDFLVVRVVFV